MTLQRPLPLNGHHPGPLFGPLPIKRASEGCRRGKLYRKKLRAATPPWADREAIRALYRKAKRLTRETGVKHTVDHIIPLKGETVCGLHVHTNMRVIPHSENMRKGNFFVDQPSLF